ncbi:MAG: UDP-3-O-(3-hydroxymyristoyl)glucosamine N-acyltransferase [Sphingobacteriales bacterium]|nr:UDP-3-O-(3-hydroxymyristoyl)glucosamine N-acyltransferase [Sphingobacteriales bacterium]
MQFPQPYRAGDIAAMLSAVCLGNDDELCLGINEIHKVQAGDISFVDHPKYYQKCLQSAASVIIINEAKVANPLQKTLIISEDPFRDYNRLATFFRPLKISSKACGETVNIDETAQIAHNVAIGNHVSIGANTIIYPNVVIYDHTHIGSNVIVHANTTLGSDAFYYKKRTAGNYEKMHSCGRLLIEDNVEIGAGCTIDRGVSGDTIIGAGCKIDNQVHIGHGVVLGKNCLIAAQVGIAGKTSLGNGVTIWGQVGINKSLHIGEGAVVLAKSGVPKSLEGGKVYFGIPVEDARDKMRELAYLKQVPELAQHVWSMVRSNQANENE